MKVELHVVGLGSGGLKKQTLEKYDLFSQADLILTNAPQHPCIEDITKNGFKVEMIQNGQENSIATTHIIDKLRELWDSSDISLIVLALPGFPLAEGKQIACLIENLEDMYSIRLDTIKGNGSLEKLTAIMWELRKPEGCPWDKEQTHESLKKYVIEETYEVIDAIDTNNMHNLCEELGDLLLQVVFHAVVGEEKGTFTLEQIISGISQKLIRRHPHVFGNVIAENSKEVVENWEMIKKKEKVGGRDQEDDYFDIPSSLPALMLAAKTQKKAAKIGFDWEGHEGPLDKVYEEINELEKALANDNGIEEEFGDILFSLVNLARFLELDAEEALRKCVAKFQKRFNRMLAIIKNNRLDSTAMSIVELDEFWELAKSEEKNGK